MMGVLKQILLGKSKRPSTVMVTMNHKKMGVETEGEHHKEKGKHKNNEAAIVSKSKRKEACKGKHDQHPSKHSKMTAERNIVKEVWDMESG